MKLQDLMEMPQLTDRELGDSAEDDHEPMTVFFITNERLNQRYDIVGQRDNAVVALAKDKSSGMVGIKGVRKEDNAEGVHIFGDVQFKLNPNLGFRMDSIHLKQGNILQVGLVNVVKDNQFIGLGSFLYSSLVQAGYTIISDNHHFKGGKALWQKLGRTHLQNEAVYLIDRGNVLTDEQGRPIEYNGSNIPDDRIWSADEQHAYVLFIYKRR